MVGYPYNVDKPWVTSRKGEGEGEWGQKSRKDWRKKEGEEKEKGDKTAQILVWRLRLGVKSHDVEADPLQAVPDTAVGPGKLRRAPTFFHMFPPN